MTVGVSHLLSLRFSFLGPKPLSILHPPQDLRLRISVQSPPLFVAEKQKLISASISYNLKFRSGGFRVFEVKVGRRFDLGVVKRKR